MNISACDFQCNVLNSIVRDCAENVTDYNLGGAEIITHGNSGDAFGYAMRGGIIYVKGNAGTCYILSPNANNPYKRPYTNN